MRAQRRCRLPARIALAAMLAATGLAGAAVGAVAADGVTRNVQNGRVIVSKDAASASTTSTLIGVLSDQPTSLDGFAAVHPASVAARVVHVRADDIAESAIPLRAFDILAIDDFATDSLTA